MEYEIKLEQWSGPLEKLLELIEGEKLGINDVSLAKVTDGFLKYLEKFREGGEGEERFRVDLRILADFISVASKLIFLKSKYLLPGLALTDEEEEDIKDLEERLKIYQQIKPALKLLQKLWRTSHKSYSRPYFLGKGLGIAAGQSFFYPGDGLAASEMHFALSKIFDNVKTYAFETETIKEKIITLEEKIKEVLGRIQAEGNMQFKKLSTEKSRSEAIVIFLAILHLAREQLVLLEQMENFSDIMVRHQVKKPDEQTQEYSNG
jgi:segregation and condensation protein A